MEINTLKLIEENQRYRLAIEGSQSVLWEWDKSNADSLSLVWDGAFHNEADRIHGKWTDHIHQDDIEILKYHLNQCIEGKHSQFDCEHRILDKNGCIRWMVTRGKVIISEERFNMRIVGMSFDITARRAHEHKLHEMAIKDSLTGLLNRAAFSEKTHEFIESAKDTDQKAVLLFLDLDDFKAVNDTWGHDVGDAVLIEAAMRLKSCVRGKDSIARLGGDEFTILIDEIDQIGKLEGIIDRIQVAFERPFKVADHMEYVSISVGAAILPDDGLTAESLLKCADMDMYRSKRVNRLKQGGLNE